MKPEARVQRSIVQALERTKDAQFDLEVFNITGALDRSTLEQRMKLFL